MRRTPLKSENTIKPIIQQMLEIGGRATGVTIEEKPGGSTIFMVDVLEAGQKKEVRRNEEKRRKKKIRDEAKLAEQEIALKGGCVTPCTETEMGAVADTQQSEFRQSQETASQGEVVALEQNNQEKMVRNEATDSESSLELKQTAAKEIAACLQAVTAKKANCYCNACKVRLKSSNKRYGGWPTEETVGIIRHRVREITWPKSVQQLKMLVAITEPTKGEGQIEARGHLAYVELVKCRVQLNDELLQEGDKVVVEDARHLVYGYAPEWSECKFDERIKIRLVTKKQDLVLVQGKRDRSKQVFDCTDQSRMPWLMQDTNWDVYADEETRKWVEVNDELTEAMEQMYGVILVRSRQSDEDRARKKVTLEELLCPLTCSITPDLRDSIASFEEQQRIMKLEVTAERKRKLQLRKGESDSEYSDSEEDLVDCVVSQGKVFPNAWAFSREKWEALAKIEEATKIRILMWNPENLSQRLDLDGAVAKGKSKRANSPPLRSVRAEWADQIRVIDPDFVVYNEASIPGGDTMRRKNHKKVIQEVEDFHSRLGYELIIGFHVEGRASHGGAIAIKKGILVTKVEYGFSGGREQQGRVLCVRVATEEQEFKGKTVDGMWIVQMYMHNSGAAKRRSMMAMYKEWQQEHGEPVVIGSDTNSIDQLGEDVELHVANSLKDVVGLENTLDMITGEPIVNAGLETAEIFLKSRTQEMHKWGDECDLEDAQGPNGGISTHTVHFAWMRWFKYAKANENIRKVFHGMPPCITARIDRFLLSRGIFEVSRVEFFNDLERVDHRNEYAQVPISNFSDHYAGALEFKMKVKLKVAVVTQSWPNNLYQIHRTSIQMERLLRLGEPDVAEENVVYNEVVELQESRLEVPRDEMTDPVVIQDKWRSVTRSAMELKCTLKAMASAIQLSDRTCQSNCAKKEVKALISSYQEAGWIDLETDVVPRDAVEDAQRGEFIRKLHCVGLIAAKFRLWHKSGRQVVEKVEENHGNRMGQGEDRTRIRGHTDLQKTLQSAISKAVSWKSALQGRRFGLASALHHLAGAYSTSGPVKQLIKVRTNEDPEEASRKLVERVVACQQERQCRRAQKQNQIGEVVVQQEEVQQQLIEDLIESGQIDSDSCGLQDGVVVQLESRPEVNALQTKFRRIPRGLTYTVNEKKRAEDRSELDLQEINKLEVEEGHMKKIIKATNPRRTTRIKGQVAVADWSIAMSQKKEATATNCEFGNACHEDDILLDTGCSYTIVSKDWLFRYCLDNHLDVESVLIPYPEDYENPKASTAAQGSIVEGIGFAKIKLRLVTLPQFTKEGQADLKWTTDSIEQGSDGASVVEIDTYVHVFAGMGSSMLLGMPFIQDFTERWDFGSDRVRIKTAEKREIPLHPSTEMPMKPIMICAKEEVYVESGQEVDIEGYTVGALSFPTSAQFDTNQGRWLDKGAGAFPGVKNYELQYGIEPIQQCKRLHIGGFTAYGVEGRSIPQDRLQNPTVRIQSGREGLTIPAGTPLGLVVQKCEGVPTHIWDPDVHAGQEDRREPEVCKIEWQSHQRTEAIPSKEIQAECELKAAAFLEPTIRRAFKALSTDQEWLQKSEQDTDQRERLRRATVRKAVYEGDLLENLQELRLETEVKTVSEGKNVKEAYRMKMQGLAEDRTNQRQKNPTVANGDGWDGLEDKGSDEEGQDVPLSLGRAEQLAKMLVQMLWHLKAVSVTRPITQQVRGEEYLTTHTENEEEGRTIKALLYQVKAALREKKWANWFERHQESASVYALKKELEIPERWEVCQMETAAAGEETRELIKANEEMDELYKMLTNDTATEDGQMSAIMEQPVAIMEFFQPKDKEGNLIARAEGWDKIDPSQVLGLIDEDWRMKIIEACKAEVDDNGVEVEDPDRPNRLATYMMQVDTASIKDDPALIRALFELILRREAFFNINPNNPPRFKGLAFDYVQLRKGEDPIAHQERRIPPAALTPVLQQIKEWIRQGVVEKSNSPHSSPLLLVKKKALSPPLLANGLPDPDYVAKIRYRTCVDYVQLNHKSEPTDISNAPRVDELLEHIGNAGSHKVKAQDEDYWVSTVDLYAGFNQWYLSDEVKPLTAFTVPGLAAEEGRLQFRVLPFGLSSAPTRFNSLVATTLAELRFCHHEVGKDGSEACCTNYVDDVYVAGICTFERHLKDMDLVFGRLQHAGFGARMDKAEFCRHSISMLGWTIAEGHKSAQTEKLETIDKLLDECKDVKDVLSLLGTIGFYRQLIPMSGDIEAPLYDLTRKGAWKEGAWTPVHTACVALLKYHLKEQVKLALPRIGNDPTGKPYPPMQLITDASQYAGGAVLFQEQEDGVERPICFASKTFTKEQRNWSATERELWTLQYFATEHFKQYFFGNPTVPILYTDHKPLTYLFTKRNVTNAKLARWSAKLSKLQALVVYRCGAKMGPADSFSRLMQGRPERAQRNEETPEKREPLCNHRGSLQEYEPQDTEERGLSLPRVEGVPQQRTAFLKGYVQTKDEGRVEPDEDSDYSDDEEQHPGRRLRLMKGKIDPWVESKVETEVQQVSTAEPQAALTKAQQKEVARIALKRERGAIQQAQRKEIRKQTEALQGRILTQEEIAMLDEDKRAHLSKIGTEAEKNGVKPEFRIALVFDMTRIESSITTDQERSQRSLEHRGLETPEEVQDGETIAQVFPPTVVAWTDIKRKTMSEIFVEATGIQPEDEEEEYICRMEEMGPVNESLGPEAELCVLQAMQGQVDPWMEIMETMRSEQDEDSDYSDEEEQEELHWQGQDANLEINGGDEIEDQVNLICESRDWTGDQAVEVQKTEVFISQAKGEDARQPQNSRKDFQAKGEDARQPQVADKQPFKPEKVKWTEIRETITKITRARLKELSQDGDDKLSPAQEAYIESLTDPDVSVVVCQGGAGCGKTYTAMLAACLAVQAGLLSNVKQTKPLVSTGGVGLGYERGEMSDKLKYWCAPAREAMERMGMSEENAKKIEPFPIDRTRGISVPAGEWMIFDEMQNAPASLFKAAMTRAERYGKVVICGDKVQKDVASTKPLGMEKFLDAWSSMESVHKQAVLETEECQRKLQGEMTTGQKIDLTRKLEVAEMKELKWAKANAAKQQMQDSRTTQVVILDGSKAMRNLSTNNMNAMLEVCRMEQSGQEVLKIGQEKAMRTEADSRELFEACKVEKEVWKKTQETLTWKMGKAIQRQQIEKANAAKQQTEGVDKVDTREAPVFASFAGMDLLGKGIKKKFKESRCIGGSEINSSARVLFEREHGFAPFRDHRLVPGYAYEKVFLVTTGAPCVAFSRAGKQKGQTDTRGCHYVDQVDAYTRAGVPVILFEQVPEARRVLPSDWKAGRKGKSPQEQLVDKLEAGGYHVPTGADGQAGLLLNAAHCGSVLDRTRLFTIAVKQELWDSKQASTWFRWPKKENNQRRLKDIFREPVEQHRLAKEHTKRDFEERSRTTETGVQYLKSKDEGLGDWFNPNTVISEQGKGVSITAMGNSRWIQFTDVDGVQQWRRLSGVETAKAFGMQENELSQFQHLTDNEIHAAVGNGVCIEMGEAMGEILRKFWDPDWFHSHLAKRETCGDVCCLERGIISTRNEPKDVKMEDNSYEKNVHWTRDTDEEQVQRRAASQHAKKQELENLRQREQYGKSPFNVRQRKSQGAAKRESYESSRRCAKMEYVNENRNDRLKLRRRLQTVLQVQGLKAGQVNRPGWDVNLGQHSYDGQSRVFQTEVKELEERLRPEELCPSSPATATDSKLRANQERDRTWVSLIRVLEGKSVDDLSQHEKATVKLESDNYTLYGDAKILCKVTTSNRTSSTIRICVPARQQDELLSLCHDNPWTCHPTCDQMYRMLSLKYYWPHMRAACMVYHRTCDVCQKTGYPPKKKGGRQFIPTSSPFACCAIDVVGPIGNKDSATESGNRFIVTIIDWFSRWVEAFPVKDCSQESILEALDEFTSRHGIPRRLVSDQAKYFRGQLVHKYEQDVGMKHTFVSAYRPQGNGKLERFHRVLGRKIKMQCKESGDKQWDKHLRQICFSHNVVPHSTTGYSPYELIYGRRPCLPFDTLVSPTEEDAATDHKSYMGMMKARLLQSWQIAHENMTDRQVESTELTVIENAKKVHYKAGDQVLLWVPTIPKGSSQKVRIKWHGPYEVQDENKGSQVVIPIPDGTGGFKDRAVHSHRIKPYRSRKVTIASEEDSLELFRLLDNYEVQRAEGGQAAFTGLDALQRSCAHEHEADATAGESYRDPGEKWQQVFDGTERVGVISGHAAQDQEVPIPEPEPSPFDTQNTIEQAICDLTERQRLSVTQCDECNRALTVTHACHACFAKSSQEGMEIEREKLPIFRGKMSQEEGMIEANCYECKKEVWIPDQYCKCNAPHEITVEQDEAIEGRIQEEQFIRSNLGGSGITYSMDYPAIVAVGVVMPQIYRGKSGMPSMMKPELWMPIKTASTAVSEPEETDVVGQEPSGQPKEVLKEYETCNIQDYDEWEQTYKTTWKGFSEVSSENLPNLVSSTSLVEEYWADPGTGVKKWKRLRPAQDNFTQTRQMLVSVKMMENQGIHIAGVRLWQGVGDSEKQVYKRLQGHDIRAGDVFIVILDVDITKDLTKAERTKHIDHWEQQDKEPDIRKLFVPVKWTWSRLQKVCTKKERLYIEKTLATEAKRQRHNCWMNAYKKCETLGAKPADNRKIIIVSQTEVLTCFKKPTQKVKQWQRQDNEIQELQSHQIVARLMTQINNEDMELDLAGDMSDIPEDRHLENEGQAGPELEKQGIVESPHENQGKEGEAVQQHLNLETFACNDKADEKAAISVMLETEVQDEEAVVEIRESQAGTGTEISEAQSTVIEKLRAELAKYKSREAKVVTEVTACLSGTSTDKDRDLVFGLRWAKIGDDVRRQEQAHDAIALIHASFVLDTDRWNEDDPKFMDHMTRCKNHMTYRRLGRGQFSFDNNGKEACEVTTVQHGEVCEVILCHNMEGEVCEVTFADKGRKSRHRQKTQLDSTQGQGGLMETAQAAVNQIKDIQSGTENAKQENRVRDIQSQQQELDRAKPEEKRHVKTEQGVTQAEVETKRGFLLRHWECNTKSEEIELQARAMELKQGQEKHEIEMQERRNEMNRQQDEHQRRMSSNLW